MRAGRTAGHHDALDAQVVEQGGQCIGLFGQRGVGREVAAQIAEARGRDHAQAARQQHIGEAQALVEAAAGAVDHQQRRAAGVAGHCVLEPAPARL